jgi:hypothetical protein
MSGGDSTAMLIGQSTLALIEITWTFLIMNLLLAQRDIILLNYFADILARWIPARRPVSLGVYHTDARSLPNNPDRPRNVIAAKKLLATNVSTAEPMSKRTHRISSILWIASVSFISMKFKSLKYIYPNRDEFAIS